MYSSKKQKNTQQNEELEIQCILWTVWSTKTTFDPHIVLNTNPLVFTFKFHLYCFVSIWPTATLFLTGATVFGSVFLNAGASFILDLLCISWSPGCFAPASCVKGIFFGCFTRTYHTQTSLLNGLTVYVIIGDTYGYTHATRD